MVELGFKMMSRSLSSVQAYGIMMDYGTTLHPSLTPGEHYRIPPAAQFRRWRRLLHPVCVWLAVTAVQEADEWFFAGDESPKKGHSVFGTAVTCVKDVGRCRMCR
jgi:hypothetical protein